MTPETQALIDKANETCAQLNDVRSQYERACDDCRALEAKTNDLWKRFEEGDNTVCDEMREAFAKLDSAHDRRRATQDPIPRLYDARSTALTKAAIAALKEIGLQFRDEDPLFSTMRRLAGELSYEPVQGQAPQ